MTMNVTGRKASLYATAMAISLVAMNGTAHAQSSTGAFKTGTWAVKNEAVGGTKTTTTTSLTSAQIAALDVSNVSKAEAVIVIAQKTAATAQILNSLSTSSITLYEAAKTADADNAAAVTAQTKAGWALTGRAAVPASESTPAVVGVTAIVGATEKLNTANGLVGTLSLAKGDADQAAADALIALTSAQTTRTSSPSTVASVLLGLDNEVLEKTQLLNQAVAAQTVTAQAYTTAVADAQVKQQAFADASSAKTTADNLVSTTATAKSLAVSTVNTALGLDTLVGRTVDAVTASLSASNSLAATGIAATYEGLRVVELYDDQTVTTTYASNGYTRATASLTAAAASTNTNISLASGALTSSAAALEVGAQFETEVLSVLVNHEGRITVAETAIAGNTTAIAALDVRTTANTTAITALDVRTTANTTAITTEAAARIAADTALGSRITAETDARIAADNVLRDQIASSTATAIAMGGAALLPDMGFTLSGNVAIYKGAQAIALNAAANVAPNAFVTASVGGGLNKNGSVGARVGFVLGFK